jgi:hypothetical protein
MLARSGLGRTKRGPDWLDRSPVSGYLVHVLDATHGDG